MGKLSKGILYILAANFINLGFNVLINFALPKFLPVDSYAAIKEFTLYLSYAGLLHLGYEDGMYLKYGGLEKGDIICSEIDLNMSTLRVFQIVFSIIILCAGLALHDTIIIVFAFVLMPYNMTMYFRNLYQAIGEFNLYGRILNAITILTFILNMGLLFGFRTKQYIYYLLVYVILYLVIWIYLEIFIRCSFSVKFRWLRFSLEEFVFNIRTGFLLMFGNFSSIILTSLDRWFVKIFLTTLDFAQYSFAVSLESFLNVAVTPITITLYNYFCTHKEKKEIRKMQRYVILFASLVVTVAFPIKWVIQKWIINYSEAISVLFLLFASQIFFILIKSIYVNLYKAKKQQSKYFVKLMIVIIAGFLFNTVLYLFFKSKIAFAVGTLLSAVLWLVLCMIDFRDIRLKCKELLFVLTTSMVLVLCGRMKNAVWGMIVYLLFVFIMTMLFLKEEVTEILSLLIKKHPDFRKGFDKNDNSKDN